MERARFPMEFLRVTQGPNTGSHAGSKAMDFGGKDTGCDVVYAPFTGRVARVRTNSSHETYFESLEPVEFADGTVDYMTVTLMHDNVLDVRTGQVLHQGEKIGDEGGFGGGRPNRFGAHLHLEVSRGRNIAYQVRNAQGTYCTPQQVDIWSALWLGTDVQVLDGAGYSWKRDTKEDDDMKFLKVTNGKCEVFTTTDVNAVDKSYNSGKLTEGVCYPVQAEVGSSGGYNWVRIFVAGEKRYAVVLSDRCQLVTLSPGDAFNACVAQAKPQAADPEIEKKLAAETLRADTAERERDAANKKINEAKKALGA
jgi:hypothetical protein|nr:MAG TPA: Morphogenesis protein 1 hydrolase [Caudoviricetes sp.]